MLQSMAIRLTLTTSTKPTVRQTSRTILNLKACAWLASLSLVVSVVADSRDETFVEVRDGYDAGWLAKSMQHS